jgi:hypothetical protein
VRTLLCQFKHRAPVSPSLGEPVARRIRAPGRYVLPVLRDSASPAESGLRSAYSGRALKAALALLGIHLPSASSAVYRRCVRVVSPWGWPLRESGEIPELPRSGIENEPHPEALIHPE